MVQGKERSRGSDVFLGMLGGAGVGALVAELLKPRGAGAEPINVIVDGDIRQALATLILLGQGANDKLDEVNGHLIDILAALGGEGQNKLLLPFQEVNKVIHPIENYPLFLSTKPGSLIWAVIDVTSPNVTLIFKFDDLSWEFQYNTLLNEGVDRPLFPGVWLSRYDAINSHFAMIFSAGNLTGFTWKRAMSIVVRNTSAADVTLTEGRGVTWDYT
jgi:hypothetical protein